MPLPLVGMLRSLQQAQSRTLEVESRIGLTSSQMSVLSAIVDQPGIDQRTVGATTFVDKSTVAKVIARLVRSDLVRAVRSEADSRRDHLTATESAIVLLFDATPELVRRQSVILEALPADRREAFVRSLEAVGYAGGERPPHRYVIPGPARADSPREVPWGLGRPVRASLQRHGRIWARRIPSVTAVQWLALRTVAAAGEADQKTIGAENGFDKATLTVILERLVARGWISKESDPDDRRRRIVRSTAEGTRQLGECGEPIRAVDEEFLAPLTPPEREALVSGLIAIERRHR